MNLYQVKKYMSGVKNVMEMLGIISFETNTFTPKHYLIGSGDVDKSITTNRNGYLLPEVDLLQQVTKGQTLGKVISFSGEEIETIKSISTGVVICMRKTPSVKPGDIAFLITGIDKSP